MSDWDGKVTGMDYKEEEDDINKWWQENEPYPTKEEE